jgi:heme/copper-type cytochrome/quinol oxidase subunit 2
MIGLGTQELIILLVVGLPVLVVFVLFVLVAIKYLKSGKSNT